MSHWWQQTWDVLISWTEVTLWCSHREHRSRPISLFLFDRYSFTQRLWTGAGVTNRLSGGSSGPELWRGWFSMQPEIGCWKCRSSAAFCTNVVSFPSSAVLASHGPRLSSTAAATPFQLCLEARKDTSYYWKGSAQFCLSVTLCSGWGFPTIEQFLFISLQVGRIVTSCIFFLEFLNL